MFEFDTSFTIDTGNLGQTFSGSGVHLYRDVSFSFQLIDLQENTIENDQELILNPLVNSVSFDILDYTGGLVIQNYKSGTTSRSFNLTELENESIFGEYTKDFGVRMKMSNNVNSNIFVSEFYAYGNTPVVIDYDISDGSADQYLINEQVYEEIILDVEYSNQFEYMAVERYDIYASTDSEIVVYESPLSRVSDNEDFLYSQYTKNVEDVNQVIIKPIELEYNIPYYFKVVPWSYLGSGTHINFGPKIFAKEITGSGVTIVSANQFELFAGEESVNFSLLTGLIDNSGLNVLDSNESGIASTILYTVQIKDGSGYTTSSELKLVLNSGSSTFLESTINNTGQLTFSIDQSGLYNLFNVSGVIPDAYYKIYKTSM